jgi:hypothetical protein
LIIIHDRDKSGKRSQRTFEAITRSALSGKLERI